MPDLRAAIQHARHPGALYYGRHFALLGGISTVLVVSSRWRPSGVMASIGLYGALHAAAIVVTLRAQSALSRKLLFIAMATALSLSSVALGGYCSRFTGTLTGRRGLCLVLTVTAACGAATYAVLVRRFWIAGLPLGSVVKIAFGCVSATLLALAAGTFLGTLGGMWFTLVWWCAFSLGLWGNDVRNP